PESKISRAKKKRFDKYVEHQLKREEKQILIEKLQDSKFDTSLLRPSRLLGQGRMTKKEEFKEALDLEKQGRGDERTKEVLYEEREVRDWDEDMGDTEPVSVAPAAASSYDNYSDGFDDEDEGSGSDSEDKDQEDQPKSTFVDLRPTALGGSGFGFQNIPKAKKVAKKSYTWRSRVMEKELAKGKAEIEDEADFDSDSDEEEEEEEEEVEADTAATEASLEENEESSEEEEEEEDQEEESSEEEADEDDSEEEEVDLRSKFEHSLKAESFKNWAAEQIRKLEGRSSSESLNIVASLPDIDYKPQIHEEDLDDGLIDNSAATNSANVSKGPAKFITIERPQAIQDSRMDLPVYAEEHRIMEAINHHDVVILCGETGSGKTTQVPQFLYESGYAGVEGDDSELMIGVTQPRRVAAVSMSERVSVEMGDHGDKVAHQIRFDSNVHKGTKLKFMTDGVLLREMTTDFIMQKYGAIVIDEAHERGVNTDILIGMLSRVVRLRAQLHSQDPKKYKKLKLVIMSATLRVSDFTENTTLFQVPPPVLQIQARQYPVSVHFNKTTKSDYVDEAFRKACKIHRKLPKGGILIFLTGQAEITGLVKKLKKEFPFPAKNRRAKSGKKTFGGKTDQGQEEDVIPDVKVNSKQADYEAEDIEFSVKSDKLTAEDQEEADDYVDSEDEEGFEETLDEDQTAQDPLFVLPLYSLLPQSEQMKVFNAPPGNSRLCIVSTNVAETSLTIPGIRYVIDCGRSKERQYDEDNGIQSFEINWVSKASAGQRSGRAGRTGPGHCYRLYSSAVYENDFTTFAKPEIQRMPIESIVLNMKAMGIENVVNFPFPTVPDRYALSKAEKLLKYLGALDADNKVTQLGKNISLFPLAPRFAKILLLADQGGCLGYVVAIVSALSVGDPFINENELGFDELKPKAKPAVNKNNDDSDGEVEVEEEQEQRVDPAELERKRKLRSKFNSSRAVFSKLDANSDALRVLSAVCAFDHIPSPSKSQFCSSNFLREKQMQEIVKLRKQITYLVKSITTRENIAISVSDSDLQLPLPSKTQIKLIKQMLTAGFLDQIAIRVDLLATDDFKITNAMNIQNIPYSPVVPLSTQSEKIPYVYIHPTSMIMNAGEIPPEYLVYQSITTPSNINPDSNLPPKPRMRLLTTTTPVTLTNLAKGTALITYSKPLGPPYAPKFIDGKTDLRECYVVPRFGSNVGNGNNSGWDLKVLKVRQRRVNGVWVNE
ncbi:hypothetical protein WICPIJ_003482, partial [Wickerhamomyces pijperi]